MCLMECIVHCTIYWTATEIEMHIEHRKTFKMEHFAKRIMPKCRCANRNFSEQGEGWEFVELGHFDKHFVKNTRWRGPAGKHFEVFSLRCSLNCILNEKFNPMMDLMRAFFYQNQGTIFDFQKGQGRLLLWQRAHSSKLRAREYA